MRIPRREKSTAAKNYEFPASSQDPNSVADNNYDGQYSCMLSSNNQMPQSVEHLTTTSLMVHFLLS